MTSGRIKVLFLGSGSWSTDVLIACADRYDVHVVTYRNEATRSVASAFGPTVTEVARAESLPVHYETTPPSYTGSLWMDQFDVVVASNWRHTIPQDILDRCQIPFLNIHRGALPEFAGLSPISWAVTVGATETAVVAHLMDGTPDCGRLVAMERMVIGADDTATDVYYATRVIAPRVAVTAIDRLIESDRDSFDSLPKPKLLRHYRSGEMLRICWAEDAITVYNLVRAQSPPFPPAFCYRDGSIVFIELAAGVDMSQCGEPGRVIQCIHRCRAIVACGSGSLILSHVRSNQGGAAMPAGKILTNGILLD